MDELSANLQPYKQIIGQIAATTSILQHFSGSLICKEVIQKESTCPYSVNIFIGNFALGILNYYNGVILDDSAIMTANLWCMFLSFGYILVFLTYSTNRKYEIVIPLAYALFTVSSILYCTTFWRNDPKVLNFRYGLIIFTLSLINLGLPLRKLKLMIEKEDASSIPYQVILAKLVTTIFWVLYGIIIKNTFLILKNFVTFALCFSEIVLVIMYPGPN